MKTVWRKINRYVPAASIIFYIWAAMSGLLQLFFALSPAFSDFFNRYISSIFRFILAKITLPLPFSLAELIVLSLPLTAVAVVVKTSRISDESRRMTVRCISGMLSVCAVMYSLFVFNFAAGYKGTTLSEKLGLSQSDVTADELYKTINIVIDKLNEADNEVSFEFAGASDMPYNKAELSAKLCEAYNNINDTYTFIPTLTSRAKPIVISPLMTYTHISGVYSFFTGEANINTNYPDFVIAYTAAHELAHQRGIAREDEANFVAYLVCVNSDDAYLRYSGYLNMYEYLATALFSASPEYYNQAASRLEMQVIYELNAYNKFFEKYRDSTASAVSGTINDTFLTIQGTEGSKSYGLVVDLAVNYYAGQSD